MSRCGDPTRRNSSGQRYLPLNQPPLTLLLSVVSRTRTMPREKVSQSVPNQKHASVGKRQAKMDQDLRHISRRTSARLEFVA